MGRRNAHILVVEDHSDTAWVVRKLLERAGYFVECCNSAAEARALASVAKFDLILCDLGLRDGDGCDLVRDLRASYPVKAIALTGFGMPEDFQRTATAGFSTHLLKPISGDKLIETVDRVLAQQCSDNQPEQRTFTTEAGRDGTWAGS